MNDEAFGFEGCRGQSVSFREIDDGQYLAAITRIVLEGLGHGESWLDGRERRRLLHQSEMWMNYCCRPKLESVFLINGSRSDVLKKFRSGK